MHKVGNLGFCVDIGKVLDKYNGYNGSIFDYLTNPSKEKLILNQVTQNYMANISNI